MTIAECLRRASELATVSDSPRLDLEVLLAHALGKQRTYLYTWPERRLDRAAEEAFLRLFAERKRGRPVAQILGQKEFWSLSLKVDDSTLIPRPETEMLVETALQLLPATEQRILDLGTGTGAIALALASERPAWSVLAVDKNADAVRLAEENSRSLQLNNVSVGQSDWFSQVGARRFDLIISNPPYIAADDEHLEQGDLRFEPRAALVAEEQGLADIRRILEAAPAFMTPSAWLIIEHGWTQRESVRAAFTQAGFVRVDSRRDIGGRERLTLGQKAS